MFKADGDRFKRWETNWKHSQFPNLMVTVEYDTTDAPEEHLWPDMKNKSNTNAMSLENTREEHVTSSKVDIQTRKNNCSYTCVKNVNISIDIDDEDTGILFMNDEMEPLIEYCQVSN